jgi:hypothetical protein
MRRRVDSRAFLPRAALALALAMTIFVPRPTFGVTNMADVASTTVVPEGQLNGNNFTLDVFAFPAPPTSIPDVRGVTPEHSQNASVVDFSALPTSVVGTTLTHNCLGRVRGRLRAPLSGTFSFILETSAGGVVSIDGGVVCSLERAGNATGRKYLLANEDVEIEVMGYNRQTANFKMVLYWAYPGRLNTAEVIPASAFYVPLDDCCSCKCGARPCRSSGSGIECLKFASLDGSASADAVDLEDVFAVY